MSIAKDPSRNRSGLTYLRARYIARAVYLVSEPRSGFLEAVEEVRRRWGETYPGLAIIPTEAPERLSIDLETLGEGILWPPRLKPMREVVYSPDAFSSIPLDEAYEVQSAVLDWQLILLELCQKFWPEEYFVNPVIRVFRHAAAGVVSAAILHLSKMTRLEDRIEALIPPFALEPTALEFSPFSRYPAPGLAQTQGMLNYYKSVVEDLLSDDIERLEKVTSEATMAGWEFEHEAHPEGPVPQDPRSWWWYVPILPGMSAEDLRLVAASAEAAARVLSGDTPMDQMIKQLKLQGRSHQEVADLLGIDRSTVTRRWKAVREG